MQSGKPSRTAWAAAAHRAAHQVLERGAIFADPLALRILGEDAQTVARWAEDHSSGRAVRIFIAARARFAEDSLTAAVQRGVRQLVVLGAGLDTYAYRTTLGDRLRVFEVDRPATQAWKRQRLEQAAIPLPPWLTFAPVDFERETLAEGLAAAGLDREQRTFFTCLGVVPYLTEEAVRTILGFMASLPHEAHVVFDYSDPPASLSAESRDFHERRAARVAEIGEAWVSYFEKEKLRDLLAELGFSEIEDLGPPEIATLYFPTRARPAHSLTEKGGHVVHAATV